MPRMLILPPGIEQIDEEHPLFYPKHLSYPHGFVWVGGQGDLYQHRVHGAIWPRGS